MLSKIGEEVLGPASVRFGGGFVRFFSDKEREDSDLHANCTVVPTLVVLDSCSAILCPIVRSLPSLARFATYVRGRRGRCWVEARAIPGTQARTSVRCEQGRTLAFRVKKGGAPRAAIERPPSLSGWRA